MDHNIRGYEARLFSLGKLGGKRKRELVVAERSSVEFVKMVESKPSGIARDPGNPLRLRLWQLCSRRVKKREGQDDLHKAAHMKRSEVLMGTPGGQAEDRTGRGVWDWAGHVSLVNAQAEKQLPHSRWVSFSFPLEDMLGTSETRWIGFQLP